MLNLHAHGLGNEFPKLASLQEEIASLQREKDRADREVVAAQQAILSAREQDSAEAAKAIRAGKSVPTGKNEAKAQAALEGAERALGAYQQAVVDAQTDLANLTAKHSAQLHAAVLDALNRKAVRLAECAREAAQLYGALEDGRRDLRDFAPPPAVEFSGEPQKLTNAFVGVMHVGQRGPARGEVEQMLAYLSEMKNEFAPVGETSEETPDAAA